MNRLVVHEIEINKDSITLYRCLESEVYKLGKGWVNGTKEIYPFANVNIDIKQHNPPLKLEDIYENRWVWNNQSKRYIKAEKLVVIKKVDYIMSSDTMTKFYVKFEEEKFYAREVKDVR